MLASAVLNNDGSVVGPVIFFVVYNGETAFHSARVPLT
jgi:mannose/fructose/N-acetylgalactosamine-specific phosphotransferase system component IID